jgi:hypothetical protein
MGKNVYILIVHQLWCSPARHKNWSLTDFRGIDTEVLRTPLILTQRIMMCMQVIQGLFMFVYSSRIISTFMLFHIYKMKESEKKKVLVLLALPFFLLSLYTVESIWCDLEYISLTVRQASD